MAGDLTKQMMDDMNCKNPYILAHPITINNKTVKQLSWSADDITVELFLQAGSRVQSRSASGLEVMENNINYHFWIGCAMVIAVNPEIDFEDLKQLQGPDLVAITALGRFFITLSAGSIASSSDEPSEPTHTSTQPALPTSNDKTSETS